MKKKRWTERFSAWLLVVAVLLAAIPYAAFAASALGTDVWDGAASDPVAETDADGGPGSGYFLVSTGAELAWIMEQVNVEKNSFAGKTVKLTEDIDLGGREWTPIGIPYISEISDTQIYFLSAQSTAFEGCFDGAGHTVSNLSITTGGNGVGLFGYSTGTIQDVTVSGAVSGGHFVGGVVAVGSGTISGVTSQVEVVATGNYVAGVLGEGVGSVTVADCHNETSVSNSSSSRSTGKVAGIVGRVDSGSSASITRCSNIAQITGYQYIAGIIGGQFGNVSVSDCCNTGDIQGISFGKVYLGGITGKLEGGTITNCYNTGDLYCEHWLQGHVRAIGGIAGCEEDHATGTAITNCYTTGVITIETNNMVYGDNWIYMTGNISGGNSASAANTMQYENCYYLENRIAIADPSSPSYQLWADIYKDNPLVWDTVYITKATQEEFTNGTVLSGLGGAFTQDEDEINNGYPILYWQAGMEAPRPTYRTSGTVTGGTAELEISPASAAADARITLSLSQIETGKQIKEVTVTDAAGGVVPVTPLGDGQYTFQMPARNAAVRVVLENVVDEDAPSFQLTLPEGLDAIWTVEASSTYLDGEGNVKAGSTVFIHAARMEGANTSSLEGITVTSGGTETAVTILEETNDNTGMGESGFYSFTMPAADTVVALDVSYALLEVCKQTGSGTVTVVDTYTREDMLSLADPSVLYYSGWSSETEAFVAKAEQAVTLSALLRDAGLQLSEGDTLKTVSADGMTLSYPYDLLYNEPRSYYPNIFLGTEEEACTERAVPVEPMLVIKGFLALERDGDIEDQVCDTLNAYRFVYGQTEDDLMGHKKAVDQMPKNVVRVIVVTTPAQPNTPSTPSAGSGTSGVSASTAWDGSSVSTSFAGGTGAASNPYRISSAAQLAYLAQLVNSGSPGDSVLTGQYFLLTTDLDLAGYPWTSIGGGEAMTGFNGVFDGGGHIIRNLYINSSASWTTYTGRNQGLFGIIDGDGVVRNLGVTGEVHAQRSVGGIAGKSSGLIECCFNAADISATDSKGVGGIVGANWNQSIVRSCYNVGQVTSSYASGSAGGIAGENEYLIENCYNAGRVQGSYNAGGILGSDKHSGGSSSAGPLTGRQINCYFLQGTASTGVAFEAENNQNTVTEVTETQLKALAGDLGSDFAADERNINGGYPILSWQVDSATQVGGVTGSTNTDNDNDNMEHKTVVENGSATITVNSKALEEDLKDAGTETQIVFSVEIPGGKTVSQVKLALTGGDVEAIVKTGASLKFSSPLADITLTNSVLKVVDSQSDDGGSAVTVSATAQTNGISITVAVDGTVIDAAAPQGLLVSLPLEEAGDGRVMVLVDANGEETVIKKSVAGEGWVTARLDGSCTVRVINNAKSFTDVNTEDWFAGEVDFVTAHELFIGTSPDCFEPNETMTRAMLATVLHRLEETPDTDAEDVFHDVDTETWYTDAVNWANENKIVEGYGGGVFGPDISVTREQMAVMMYRYARYLGLDVSAAGDLSLFTDADQISDWAVDAMGWAVDAGLVVGYEDDRVQPGGTATRAEVAVVLRRLITLVVK